MTQYKIAYTTNGVDWTWYGNGKVMAGNTDTDTSVRHNLVPFEATALRVYPTAYKTHISMRLEVYFK